MLLRICIMAIVLSVSASYVFAEKTYTRKTLDGKVLSMESVQIEEAETVVVKKLITPNHINRKIATLKEKILRLQGELAEMELTKIKVDLEANKVVLKVPEVIE